MTRDEIADAACGLITAANTDDDCSWVPFVLCAEWVPLPDATTMSGEPDG